MRKVTWSWLGLILLLSAGVAFASTPLVERAPQKITSPEFFEQLPDYQAPATNELDEDSAVVLDMETDQELWVWSDANTQPPVWQESDFEAYEGTYSWRCFEPQFGANGGYTNHWLQYMGTPVMDLTGTTAPMVSFYLQSRTEEPGGEPEGYDGWDTSNMWIHYDGTWEPIAPSTGPAYNVTSSFAFGDEWGMGEGIPGWGGFFEPWTEVTVDLSAYTAYSDVQFAWVFCSDPAYSTVDQEDMTGYQVDNIEVTDGGTVIFADDAEDPDNTELEFWGGMEADDFNYFDFFTGATDPPSAPTVVGMEDTEPGYQHYYTSPEFSLPELEPGQRLYLDIFVNGDLYYDADADSNPWWQLEVWDPEQGIWWHANNIRGEGGTEYIYVGPTEGWSSIFYDFGDSQWEATPLAGLDGVKMRFVYNSIAEEYAFEHLYWDDFRYLIADLEHDVATSMQIPYPTSVGAPVPGMVWFDNLGPNEETFLGLWGVGGTTTMPVADGPQITLEAGGSIETYLQTPGNEWVGWTPNEAGTDVMVIAKSQLGTDQVPSNDADTSLVDVTEEGTFVFGYDGRSIRFFINFGVDNTNVGPIGHFVPDQFTDYFTDMPLTIEGVELFWYPNDEIPAGGADFDFVLFEGDGTDEPGAEIYRETFTAPDDQSGVVISEFMFTEPQTITGDFWLFMELYTIGTADRAVPLPLAWRSDAETPLYPDNWWGIDTEGEVYNSSFDFFIHAIATGGEPTLDPPENLSYTTDVDGVYLEWDPPGGGGGEPTTELLDYVGDEPTTGSYRWAGNAMGVQMSPADACQILELHYWISIGNSGTEGSFNAEVYGWDGGAPTTDLLHSSASGTIEEGSAGDDDWNVIDISDADVMVDGDFVATFGSIDEYTHMGYSNALDNGRSWDFVDGAWSAWTEAYFIRALVEYPDGTTAFIGNEPVERARYSGPVATSKTHMDVTWTPESTSNELDEFVEYVVYRDGSEIGRTDDEMYTDMPDMEGEFEYYVTAMYTDGESDPSNTVTVNYTSVGETGAQPTVFALHNAYPNPFNPTTTMRFDVPQTSRVSLAIYNVMGQRVTTLVDRQLQVGSHAVTFDASSLSSGIYFVRMDAPGFNAVQKIMLMK